MMGSLTDLWKMRKRICRSRRKLLKKQIKGRKTLRRRQDLRDQAVKAVAARSYYPRRGKGGSSKFP